jgi:ADP-ribose pyrophosphatase
VLNGLLSIIPRKAVAVLTILRSKTNAFALSTVIIEQYRPPIDKVIIGMHHSSVSPTLSIRLIAITELPAGVK